jgi:hypothetical protein
MGYYDQEMLAKQAEVAGNAIGIRNRELIPNLKAQRQELVHRVQKIDTLLELLEKNPEFVKMLDLTRELI